jgi:lipopolysaccharide export LptBFGC system permease protein LptF
MQVLFRLAYALVVGILISLFVVLGTHTFYDEPDFPDYRPSSPPGTGKNLYCDGTDCYVDGQLLTPSLEQSLSAPEKAALEDAREFQRAQRDYEKDREDYFRNVFIIAHAIGIAAIAVGLYLYRRVEALPLGLLLGGIGAVIYGWVESSRGPDTMGTAPLFVAVTVGLVVVLGAGYWFLGVKEGSGHTDQGAG